jgi:hypothetical protein
MGSLRFDWVSNNVYRISSCTHGIEYDTDCIGENGT